MPTINTEKQPAVWNCDQVNNMSLKDAALFYASLGWRVHPLIAGTKKPVTNWRGSATTESRQIQRWWSIWPKANVGIVTGEGGPIVLDVDIKKGQPGDKSLVALLPKDYQLSTLGCQTPSGGSHHYFTATDNKPYKNKADFRKGLDFRGDGGFIVAAPSVIDGNSYQWFEGDGHIDPIPSWLDKALQAQSKKPLKRVIPTQVNSLITTGVSGAAPVFMSQISQGGRNDTLFKKACKLRAAGVPLEGAEPALASMNEELCDEPLEQEELDAILSSAYSYKVDLDVACTDMGNGQRLLAMNEGNIAYIPELGRFLIWSGSGWVFDTSGKMMRLAKKVPTTINLERVAAENTGNKGLAELLFKHHLYSQSLTRLKAMVEVVQSDIPVPETKLDGNDFLLGVNNGVVDLRTGELLQPQRHDYITKSSTIYYDPQAECPRWLTFVDSVMQSDPQMIDYLQKMAGYMLTGSCQEQVMFFLYGHGANGKSTFVNVLSHVLAGYASTLDSSMLMVQRGSSSGQASPELARLRGVRLAVSSELEEGARFNEPLIKSMTGQDKISCRELYKSTFEYTPKFKLVMVGNHKPYIRGTDGGIWRRMQMIGFNACIPEANRDPHLESKLISEAPGILNWMLQGCLKWQSERLCVPDRIKADVESYKGEQDLVGNWMEDCCTLQDNSFTSCVDLYRSFNLWSKDSGEWSMSKRKLTEKLVEKGFEKRKRNTGQGIVGLTCSNLYPAMHEGSPGYVVGQSDPCYVAQGYNV